MKQIDRDEVDDVLRTLAAHRLLVYISGLALISSPTISRAVFRNEIPRTVRTVIVIVSFAGIVLTYIGERRITDVDNETLASERTQEGPRSELADSTYSRQARRTFAIGIICIAIGVYAVYEVSALIGMLFIVGALLVGQSAYHSEHDSNGAKK
jgi:hypothetical protein